MRKEYDVNGNKIVIKCNSTSSDIEVYDFDNDFEMTFKFNILDKVYEMLDKIPAICGSRTMNTSGWFNNNYPDLYGGEFRFGNWVLKRRCKAIKECLIQFVENELYAPKKKEEVLKELNSYPLNKLMAMVSIIENKKKEATHA